MYCMYVIFVFLCTFINDFNIYILLNVYSSKVHSLVKKETILLLLNII